MQKRRKPAGPRADPRQALCLQWLRDGRTEKIGPKMAHIGGVGGRCDERCGGLLCQCGDQRQIPREQRAYDRQRMAPCSNTSLSSNRSANLSVSLSTTCSPIALMPRNNPRPLSIAI